MDFWEAVRQRHSVREYDPAADVAPEQVRRILDAAISAPSAGNCQPWRFVVVRDQGMRRALANAAYDQSFVAQAPVVIAVCAEPKRSSARYGRRGTELYCIQDTAAAVEHILLAATALDLGSCWVGAFDEADAARALELPKDLRPVALIPIGRSAERAADRTTRRSIKEVVTYR